VPWTTSATQRFKRTPLPRRCLAVPFARRAGRASRTKHWSCVFAIVPLAVQSADSISTEVADPLDRAASVGYGSVGSVAWQEGPGPHVGYFTFEA